MIPDWAERFFGESRIAEYDLKSGEAVSWGRQVIAEIPDDLFDNLKAGYEMACIFPDWFLIEKRLQFADLLMSHGGVRFVGLGPSGGFKWVTFADDSSWSHLTFKTGALKQLNLNHHLLVKCNKEGDKIGGGPRLPFKVFGRASKCRNKSRRRGR